VSAFPATIEKWISIGSELDLLVDACDGLARVPPLAVPATLSAVASWASERHTVVPVTVGLSRLAR
jgi:hypothetical protein